MSEIILYRGDASKIKEFKYKQTSKYSLLGQGIYLTNKESIAHTYRDKGTSDRNVITLFDGNAKNRPDALDKGFGNFLHERTLQLYGLTDKRLKEPKFKAKHEAAIRQEFDMLVMEKRIVADYSTKMVFGSFYKGEVKPMIVKWAVKDEPSGYMSRFRFPEPEFSSSMFNVDSLCHDKDLWTLFYEAQLDIGTPHHTLEGYLQRNVGNSVCAVSDIRGVTRPLSLLARIRGDTNSWDKLRKVLQPYGYRGFEYHGGKRIGGGGNHRAFCVWDEGYVNDHLDKRYR